MQVICTQSSNSDITPNIAQILPVAQRHSLFVAVKGLILLLHYFVKSRSRSLAIYNNEFILGSACIGSENHCESTKSLKVVTCLILIISTLKSCCQTCVHCAVAHCLELFPQCLKASSQVLCTFNFSAEIL